MLSLYTADFHLLFLAWWCSNMVKASGFIWQFKKTGSYGSPGTSLNFLFVFEMSTEHQWFFTCSFEYSQEVKPILGWIIVSLNLVTMAAWHFVTLKYIFLCAFTKKEGVLLCLRIVAFGHRSASEDKQDVLVQYFRPEHRSTSAAAYIILLSDRVPSSTFWIVCAQEVFIFFCNTGEIFIIVAGLWYSFPIYLPKMRSHLKKKNHKKGLIVRESLNKECFSFSYFFFFIFGSTDI